MPLNKPNLTHLLTDKIYTFVYETIWLFSTQNILIEGKRNSPDTIIPISYISVDSI